tara:strand:- start:17 stop:805 length:789 start_codon:yes stop_codon:yes gene_type:complete
MVVYSGPYLSIKYEQDNSRLINTWQYNPPNDFAYREELLEHLSIAYKFKPNQIMWVLKNLTFKVEDVTKKWIDENISKPIFKAGFVGKTQDDCDQVAFVVGKDVVAYIEVMDIFQDNPSHGFVPTYFATENEATDWLNGLSSEKDSETDNQCVSITFKGIDNNGKVIFELKDEESKFGSTVNLFKSIIEQNYFMKNNIDKYSSLTKREKDTLKLIVSGYTNQQISEKMYISSNTVRTHRNRIWKKLGITKVSECLQYRCFIN